MMYYQNLHDLLMNSSSTRNYFVTLPVALQMELHIADSSIHTAEELRRTAGQLAAQHHAEVLSESLFPRRN